MLNIENLKRYRKKMGWTQREMAEKTGIMYNSLTKYEGKRLVAVSEDTIAHLAIVLGVNISDIYDERDFILDNPFNRIKEETRTMLEEKGYTEDSWEPENVILELVKQRHFTAMMDMLGYSFDALKNGDVMIIHSIEDKTLSDETLAGPEAFPDTYKDVTYITEKDVADFYKSCIDFMQYRAQRMIDKGENMMIGPDYE